MAKHQYFVVKLSSDKTSVLGEDIEQMREQEVSVASIKIGRSLSEKESDAIKKSLNSKRKNEKDILTVLIGAYVSKNGKDMQAFAIASDLQQRVRFAEDFIELDAEDMDILRKGLEAVHEQVKKGTGVQVNTWIHYPELFSQLNAPEPKKEE